MVSFQASRLLTLCDAIIGTDKCGFCVLILVGAATVFKVSSLYSQQQWISVMFAPHLGHCLLCQFLFPNPSGLWGIYLQLLAPSLTFYTFLGGILSCPIHWFLNSDTRRICEIWKYWFCARKIRFHFKLKIQYLQPYDFLQVICM